MHWWAQDIYLLERWRTIYNNNRNPRAREAFQRKYDQMLLDYGETHMRGLHLQD
jgi:hypothetical protein